MISDREMLAQYRKERQLAGVIYPYLVVRNDNANAARWLETFENRKKNRGILATPEGVLDWVRDSVMQPDLWAGLANRPERLDIDWVKRFTREFRARGSRAILERDLLSFVERGVQAVHIYGWLSGPTARHRDVWALLCLANMLYQVEVHEQLGERHPFFGHLIMPESWGYSDWWNDEGVGPRYFERDAGLVRTNFVPVSWVRDKRWFCGFADADANVCFEVLFYAP